MWPPSLTGRFPAEIDLLVQSMTLATTLSSGSLEPQALKLTWISGELVRKGERPGGGDRASAPV